MRHLICCALISFVAAACGPVDTGVGSSAAAADGGPIWSGGGGAPDDADAGTPGPADAGGSPSPGPTTSSSCDGIVPVSNPNSVSASVAHQGGDACWYFTSDGRGDVAAEAHSSNGPARWQMWSPSGSPLGTRTGGFDLFGQTSGFEGTRSESGSTIFARYDASGAESRRTVLGGPGCHGESFLAVPGGALVLGGCEKGPLTATLFDENGAPTVSRSVAPTLVDAVGLVDANGAVLVVAWPGDAVGAPGKAAARWFDGSLSPLTGWFAVPGNGDRPALRPLAAGGAALQAGAEWTAVLRAGSSGWDGPPSFLSSHPAHDFVIVRGGRAYALVPKSGASVPRNRLELYTPEGEHCGAGTFPAEGLSVSRDGTVIGSGGEGGCQMKWWPAVLR